MRKFAEIIESTTVAPPTNCLWIKGNDALYFTNGKWVSLFKKEDFINITDRFNKHSMSLIEAIQTVPTHQRIDGLVITFEDINGDWRIYQFRGDAVDFFDENKWTDLYDYTNYIVKSITPDEEDLTVSKPDKNGNAIVSLKDKVYDESNFSGKGYKILRKNIQTIDGVRKNILTQNMINKPNTIYEIRYDFDLNGAEISIPDGCVLKFTGGSLDGGNIVFKNTYLCGDICIKNNSTCTGVLSNQCVHVDWFTDGINLTDYKAIQNAISVSNYVIFNSHIYTIGATDTIYLHSNLTIFFKEGSVLKKESESAITYYVKMLCGNNCSNVTIIGGEIIGDLAAHEAEIKALTNGIEYQCSGIVFYGGENINIKNCKIHHHLGDGIYIGSAMDITCYAQIDNCVIHNCWRHGITSVGKHIKIKNTEIYGIYWLDAVDIESDNIELSQCEDYTIENCYAHSPNKQVYSINLGFAFLKAKNSRIINSVSTMTSQINSHYGDFELVGYKGRFDIIHMIEEMGKVTISESEINLNISNSAKDIIIKNSCINSISTGNEAYKTANIYIYDCNIYVNNENSFNYSGVVNKQEIYNSNIYIDKEGGVNILSKHTILQNCQIKLGSSCTKGDITVLGGDLCIILNNNFNFLDLSTISTNGLLRFSVKKVYFINNVVASNTALGGVYNGNLLRLDYPLNEEAYLFSNYAPKYLLLYYTDNSLITINSRNNIPENYKTSGTFSKKPSGDLIYPGFQYFNTTTHKMITWDGTKWWNPDGTEATN